MRARELSAAIAAWTRDQLERLVARHLPDFRIPRVFAGYPVGPDVRADFAYTLGLLDAAGCGTVAGLPAAEAIPRLLRPIDGPATHTFFSYRVAETLARHGRFADTPGSPPRARRSARTSPRPATRRRGTRCSRPAACPRTTRRCSRAASAPAPGSASTRTRPCCTAWSSGPSRSSRAIRRAGTTTRRTAPAATTSTRPTSTSSCTHSPTIPSSRRGSPSPGGAASPPRSAWSPASARARNGSAFPWGRSTGALGVCLTIGLGALDALVFPIRAGELLTSGVGGDAIAAGLPSLVSDWPFLAEALGDAAIAYGATREDLTACLERLDAAVLARASDAARARRAASSSEGVAALTLELLDEVGSAKL